MEKTIQIHSNYIWIPIAKEKELSTVQFWIEDELVWEFQIPARTEAEGSYLVDYYADLPLWGRRGEVLRITGELPDAFFREVQEQDKPAEAVSAHPVVHFAPKNGWMNDPNGLYYQDGVYHLFFQYNMMDTLWENMSWGHAISRDLLHWEQLDTVLFPDKHGAVFSGCAVFNETRQNGLPEGIPMLVYTCAGGRTRWSGGGTLTQKMAYSLDGGKSFIRYPEILLDKVSPENRDPKIYWHESGHYYMVLYIDNAEYALFVSPDLMHWEMTQRFELEKCWECPDLREISGENGKKQWILWCADGYYFFVDFDGRQLQHIGERKEAYRTALPYAAQTFYGTEDRVILMHWMRTKNVGDTYRGVMGLPRELALTEQNQEKVVVLRPVREYEEAKKELTLPGEIKIPSAVEVVFELQEASSAQIDVFGIRYEYDSVSGLIWAGESSCRLESGLQELHLLIDKGLVEVSALDYTLFCAMETDNGDNTGWICLPEGQAASVRVYVTE